MHPSSSPLRQVIHLMVVFQPKGGKFCSIGATQCHHLKIGIRENSMNDIRT